MTKQLHTHRGHCQLCASVQAINTQTGAVAEHGYTRAGGYFSGSCPGSHHMNLHVGRDLADSHIKAARIEMVLKRALADAYSRHTTQPAFVWGGAYKMVRDHQKTRELNGLTGTKYQTAPRLPVSYLMEEEVSVAWGFATPEYQEKGRDRAIAQLLKRALRCEDYANHLESWANRITGKVDPYQVKDLEPIDWTVGDTVRIGGKKGYSAVVEAVEVRPYTTFGCRQGRKTVDVKHVLVTRPEVTEKRTKGEFNYATREARPAKKIWVAMRDIKDRKSNPLVDELKEAGLL